MEEQSKHKIPEGYFEGLYDRLKDRMEAEEVGIPLPEEEGFRVPEGYFENLADRLMERKSEKEAIRVVRLRAYRRVAAIAAAAASIVLVLKLISPTPQQTSPLNFEGLAYGEIEAYLDSYYRDDLTLTDLSTSISWEEVIWEEGSEGFIQEDAIPENELFEYLEKSLDFDETLNWNYDTQ